MLSILTAAFGFFAPFLPELLKLARERQDQGFELQRLRLSAELAEREHAWRLAEIEARADAAEGAALHAPQPSFGVQMLDAARDGGLGGWAVVPAFYLFALLDFLSGLVRPAVTYAMFGFYMAYKLARLQLMQSVSDQSFDWYEGVVRLWGDQDWAVLTLVLSYWFGHRAAKAAFGGSALTVAPGR
ncbi:MAG TPA: hypothetical protein VEH84_18270 [Alphaproteobacteria bacterium]|nr:hypothetical protein [Alphaproteobacteria bacterium]